MPGLALSMIVRDAARDLAACLASARPIVSEIVIADTGSTDDTVAIARRFGARVLSIPWESHFAEARNRALAEVRSDWVLVLDADEQLDVAARQLLPTLLQQEPIAGFQTTIRSYVLSLQDRLWDRTAVPNDGRLPDARPFPAYVEHEHVRLFRRNPAFHFVGRVHESVGPRILDSGGKIGPAGFCIHHFGLAVDAQRRARKNLLYRDLGRRKIQEMPCNAQAHLEQGFVELDGFGNLPEALELFHRALTLNPRLGVAWFFSGVTLLRLGRPADALRPLEEAERRGHATALVAETRGDAFYSAGDFSSACRCYELALSRAPELPSLASKLGLAEVRLGRPGTGLKRIGAAVATDPKTSDTHDRLILAFVCLDRIADAALAAEVKLDTIASPAPADFLRAASLANRLGHWVRAAAALERGLRLHPSEPALKQALHEVTTTVSAASAVADAVSGD
ncbi:MAG: glycosyltransferase [Acidobacteriia bacterium]|nr:glycosyltransferase [Terriglobia bacterium]